MLFKIKCGEGSWHVVADSRELACERLRGDFAKKGDFVTVVALDACECLDRFDVLLPIPTEGSGTKLDDLAKEWRTARSALATARALESELRESLGKAAIQLQTAQHAEMRARAVYIDLATALALEED